MAHPAVLSHRIEVAFRPEGHARNAEEIVGVAHQLPPRRDVEHAELIALVPATGALARGELPPVRGKSETEHGAPERSDATQGAADARIEQVDSVISACLAERIPPADRRRPAV